MAILIASSVLLSSLGGSFQAFASTTDRIHPQIFIKSPDDKAVFAVGKIIVKGTAFDNESGMKFAGVKVNSGAYIAATSTSSAEGKYSTWTASIPSLAPGNYRLTAKAQDVSGNLWWDHVYVTVSTVDKVAATIVAPSDMVAHATGVLTSVTLGTPSVSDNSGKAPIVTKDAPAKFPIGSTTVTWKATDSSGNSATDEQLVKVVDWTRPIVDVQSPSDNAKLSVVPTTLKVIGTYHV